MANVLFALRGNSLTPRRNPSPWTNQITGVNVAPTVGAAGETGNLSGGYINLDHGSYGYNGFLFPAKACVSTGQKISMLIRARLETIASSQPLIMVGGPNLLGTIRLYWLTGNTFGCSISDYAGNTIATGSGTFAPTAGVYYDFLIVADMSSLGVGNVKLYVDNVAKATITPTATWPATRMVDGLQIMVGTESTSGLNQCQMHVDEIVIWDDVVNPASVTLDSGTGALNGASRTSTVAAVVQDLSVNTFPATTNVRSGTSFTQAGVAQTGTAAIPSAANVRNGTAVDATTGTLVVPSASDVRSGTVFDNGTSGTCAVPTAANVRSGTSVDNTTGTLAVPSVANVRSGISVDAGTGTLVVPSLANTKIGVSGDGGTGTYDGSDRWSDPGQTNTRSGTAYKANSTTNNKVGSAAIPGAANVRSGTAVDATTGTLVVPARADVRSGTAGRCHNWYT
jgi:hypothetical protein